MCFKMGLAGLLAAFASVFLATAAEATTTQDKPYVVTHHVEDWAYSAGEGLTITTRIESTNKDAHSIRQLNYTESFSPAPEQWDLSSLQKTDRSGRVSIEAMTGFPGQIRVSIDLAGDLTSSFEFSYTITVPKSMTGRVRITVDQFRMMPSDGFGTDHDPVVTDLYPAGSVPEIEALDKYGLDNYLRQLRQQGKEEGWTFETTAGSVITRNPRSLFGVIPEYRPTAANSKTVSFPTIDPDDLPEKLDWREHGPELPVRNQGQCGCCWAFALTGVLERIITAKEGIVVDISEQWLLDCNTVGSSCDSGGLAPIEMFTGTDVCGKAGLVLESELPYQEVQLECECDISRINLFRFTHLGTIDDQLPLADKVIAIKQAIMQYGPVWTALQAGVGPFLTYSGGVFNYPPTDGVLDHSAVLEGWDDTLGTEGAWILRNSWSEQWGDDGYMYIEYGSSRVGSHTEVIGYTDSLSASIRVVIEPAAARSAGAKWSINTYADWLNSTDTISNLAPGDYTITYKDIPGFVTPPAEILTADPQENIEHTVTYAAVSPEGEIPEGEGEKLEGEPAEGEGVNELPDDITGNCCNGCGCRNNLKKYIGNWLLVGISMLVLMFFAAGRKEK